MEKQFFIVLTIVRATRKANRRLARLLPYWATELLEEFERVNIFKLGVTLSALLFVPDRYFRKFDQTILGKSALFMTPFKVITAFASFLVILFAKIGFNISKRPVFIVLAIASLTAPLWTYAIVAFVAYIKKPHNLLEVLMHIIGEPFWWGSSAKILWSRESNIRFTIYFQAIPIFVIYVGITLPFCLLPIVVNSLFQSGLATQVINTIVIYLTAIILSWIVVRPLVFLHLACQKMPTTADFETDLEPVAAVVDQLFVEALSEDKRMQLRNKLISYMTALLARWRRQELKIATEENSHYQIFLERRRMAAELYLRGASLYLDEGDRYLRMCIDAACEARPIANLKVQRAASVS